MAKEGNEATYENKFIYCFKVNCIKRIQKYSDQRQNFTGSYFDPPHPS